MDEEVWGASKSEWASPSENHPPTPPVDLDNIMREDPEMAFQIVIMARFTPFPKSLINYLLGASSCPFLPFIAGCSAVAVPMLTLVVLLSSESQRLDGGWNVALYAGALCAVIVGIAVVSVSVQRRLNEMVEERRKVGLDSESLE